MTSVTVRAFLLEAHAQSGFKKGIKRTECGFGTSDKPFFWPTGKQLGVRMRQARL
jgi:hypothetical protein